MSLDLPKQDLEKLGMKLKFLKCSPVKSIVSICQIISNDFL